MKCIVNLEDFIQNELIEEKKYEKLENIIKKIEQFELEIKKCDEN